jgi:hypothetical protein
MKTVKKIKIKCHFWKISRGIFVLSKLINISLSSISLLFILNQTIHQIYSISLIFLSSHSLSHLFLSSHFLFATKQSISEDAFSYFKVKYYDFITNI